MFGNVESRVLVLRTMAEANVARRELQFCRSLLNQQVERMPRMPFSDEQKELILAPVRERIAALEERLEAWRRLKEGALDPEASLDRLGPKLVELRLAAGITQRELARRMGVGDSQVSRDERSGYAGVTVARASRVLAALGWEADLALRPADNE
jgi:DNA-directed RNA polymerase specialized sigma subunit